MQRQITSLLNPKERRRKKRQACFIKRQIYVFSTIILPTYFVTNIMCHGQMLNEAHIKVSKGHVKSTQQVLTMQLTKEIPRTIKINGN